MTGTRACRGAGLVGRLPRSHGHWDHTVGLIGLHRRLGRLSFPLTLHPDAYPKRAVVAQDGEVTRLVPLSRQGLRDAGLELIETERPSFVGKATMRVSQPPVNAATCQGARPRPAPARSHT